MNPNIPKYGPEYEKYKIWQAIRCLQSAAVGYSSIATYADMVDSLTPGSPQMFIVQNDESTGGTSVVYYYNGVGGESGLSILPTAESNARKIDNWQVATKAEADSFAPTLTSSAFIEVIADETQEGIRALYFWNTQILQEPLLL